MKKTTLLFIALAAACILQACRGNNNGDEDDTTSYTVDTTKHTDIVVGKDDAYFVQLVARACITEIKVGNLAKQKGADKRVKNLGAMMVKDLTKGHGRLVALAKAKKIILPDSVDTEDRKAIADLEQKAGKEFDHAYLDKIRTNYKKALDLFQNTAKTAYDPQIKAFANHNTLTIKRHLDLIDAIAGSIK